MTITNAQCAAYGNEIRAKVEEFFAPRTTETQKLIDEEKAAGRDPAQYSIQNGIVTINLYKLMEKLQESKQLGLEAAAQHEEECDRGAVPDWIGDAQKVSDIALCIAILPIILMTGNMAAAHVDLGEVFKGRLFGGDNAFIPKMRDDILNTLGISGDVAEFIKDPFNVTVDFFNTARRDLDNWLRKPFG